MGDSRVRRVFEGASGGRTLHKLRRSRLSHLADAGEDVTLIKGQEPHRSLRSLERYVNPSNAAVAQLTDGTAERGGIRTIGPVRRIPTTTLD